MDRVLVIDQDEGQHGLVQGLREQGLEVEEEAVSEDGVRRLREEPRLTVVFDENLPPVAAGDLLVVLREVSEGPIVMIGAGGETAMVEALMKGADVYLERPVRIEELAARLRSLSRRYARDSGVDGYITAIGEGQLGKIFEQLSKTETKLLRHLLERSGQLTAPEELMNSVWGECGKETSLRFYIWQLRRKLADVGSIEIMNMKGMGYLLKLLN